MVIISAVKNVSELYLNGLVGEKVMQAGAALMGMYYLVQNNPSLRKPADYESDLNALMVSVAFAFAFGVFFIARNGAEKPEKRAVANAMMWVCSIPLLMFGFAHAAGMGIALPDSNGRPTSAAHQVGPLLATTIEIAVIGEICKKRSAAKDVAWWNSWVYVFGYLAGITKDPMSYLCAWFAVGAYAISLEKTEDIFNEAMEGDTGCNMSKNSLWLAKWIWYAANHGAAAVWCLNRYEAISFADYVLVDGLSQFAAKFIFGTVLLMGLKEKSE